MKRRLAFNILAVLASAMSVGDLLSAQDETTAPINKPVPKSATLKPEDALAFRNIESEFLKARHDAGQIELQFQNALRNNARYKELIDKMDRANQKLEALRAHIQKTYNCPGCDLDPETLALKRPSPPKAQEPKEQAKKD